VGDEAGEVDAVLGGAAVGGAEAEALVFDVGEDPRAGFGDTAELGFPVAVQDDSVDVAFAGVCQRLALLVVKLMWMLEPEEL
jgi:hypothetical protein